MARARAQRRTNVKLSFCLTVLLTLSGCVRPRSALPPAEVGAVDASLGPGDAFDVRVFGEKELSGDYQVSNDGSIFFPLIGRLQVAGKDSHVVAEEIATALKQKDILRDPHVTVRVRETMSKRFSVLGAVAKPGTLSMVPGMTIVQAISQAGGFTPLASKDETVVTRRSGGKLHRYRVTVTEITRGNADDFVVSPGDIIFVPERVF
jgi:protein involved in polysaccharide export with SLBB domain